MRKEQEEDKILWERVKKERGRKKTKKEER